jgi:transposase-like protein
MSLSHKQYSREFKLEVVRRAQVTSQSQTQVAKELGITANTLSRWRRSIEPWQLKIRTVT